MRSVVYWYLPELLADQTTGSRILYATDTYAAQGYGHDAGYSMTPYQVGSLLSRGIMVPRSKRASDEQKKRTKAKAEVFTPSSICKQMNDMLEKEGEMPKDWKAYVEATILEVTCGEAPFLVSRYDTTTGEGIPIQDRIGLLDRKLRAVNENTETEAEWIKWALKAYRSVYGYEYQGDNLLFARINMFETFFDYYQDRFHKNPTWRILKPFTDAITWNLWQMDGLKDTVPLYEGPIYARIKDWKTGETIEFRAIKEK